MIAATNRDLEKEVEKGRFREDLFYRLNVFPIQVPPLRQRDQDIIKLSEAFIEKFSKSMALSIADLGKVQKQRLMSYHWPGNVRELQNVIERGVITSVGGQLNLDSITFSKTESSLLKAPYDERVLTELEMVQLQKDNIIKALSTTDWKISGDDGAANLLQIPPTTLSSRINKLGIRK